MTSTQGGPETGSKAAPALPEVNTMTADDLKAALNQGLSDFARAPL